MSVNNLEPNPRVREYICSGIKYAEEMLNCMECVSNRYNKHLSESIHLGHLSKVDVSLTHACKKLFEYKKNYEKYLDEYDNFDKNFRSFSKK